VGWARSTVVAAAMGLNTMTLRIAQHSFLAVGAYVRNELGIRHAQGVKADYLILLKTA
jgi:hypothetical protein